MHDKTTPLNPPKPEQTPAAEEGFASRWSRRKQESRVREESAASTQAAAHQPEGAQKPLPRLEDLTPESDFSPFMQSEVKDETRRAALRKLFADPHFNVMDGLDVYIEDYGKFEPLDAGAIAGLAHAAGLLRRDEKVVEPPAGQDTAAKGDERRGDGPEDLTAERTGLAREIPGADAVMQQEDTMSSGPAQPVDSDRAGLTTEEIINPNS